MHFHGLVRTMFVDFKYFVLLIWCYCVFVFVAGGGGGAGSGGCGGEHLVLYPITMYSFKSEIQRQQCSNDANFCACNQE